MKKVLLIAAVAGLSIISCKKDRSCECTHTPTSGTAYTETTKLYKVKKETGERNCIGYQTTTVSGTLTNTGDNVTCTLK